MEIKMKIQVKRVVLLAISAAILTLPIVACNAVKGAGKDLQESSDNTKDAIKKAAD